MSDSTGRKEHQHGGSKTSTSGDSSATSHGASKPSVVQSARKYVHLVLNCRTQEAEALFNSQPNKIQLLLVKGFCDALNGCLTFEDTVIKRAMSELKQVEEQALAMHKGNRGTLGRIFKKQSKNDQPALPPEEVLYRELIAADCQILQAVLTFLGQNLQSYIRGGWMLRKAWIRYQDLFSKLRAMCCKFLGTHGQNIPEFLRNELTTLMNISLSDAAPDDSAPASASSSKSQVFQDGGSDINDENSNDSADDMNLEDDEIYDLTELVTQKTSEAEKAGRFDKEYGDVQIPSELEVSSILSQKTIRRLMIMERVLSSSVPKLSSPTSSASPANKLRETRSEYYPKTPDLSCGTRVKSISEKTVNGLYHSMNPSALIGLVSAVCFGYGLLQVCFSMIPPSLTRVTRILGFQGNKELGLRCLNFASYGQDMRAPFALLGLLWYHLVAMPFLALEMNSSIVNDEVRVLLGRAEQEYGTSPFFMFFQARACRLMGEVEWALSLYNRVITSSKREDLSRLCSHDIGWCHLNRLRWTDASSPFLMLKRESQWSKSYYAYLSALTVGALGDDKRALELAQEVPTLMKKRNPLEAFIMFRSKCIVKGRPTSMQIKVYVYEILYLQNCFPSCTPGNLELIMNGHIDTAQGHFSAATHADINDKEESYISAYASCEMGHLLKKKNSFALAAKEEALRKNQQHTEGSGFENVLSVQGEVEWALSLYNRVITSSKREDLSRLCSHDIGWCHLNRLRWTDASSPFLMLKRESQWSKSYYAYLSALTVGALGDDKRALELAQEVPTLMKKRNPLEAFIMFRSKCIVKGRPTSMQIKVYVYEILYLQNCFPSCTPGNLELIMNGKSPLLLKMKLWTVFAIPPSCADLPPNSKYLQRAVDNFRGCHLEHRLQSRVQSVMQDTSSSNTVKQVQKFALPKMIQSFALAAKEEALRKNQQHTEGSGFENVLSVQPDFDVKEDPKPAPLLEDQPNFLEQLDNNLANAYNIVKPQPKVDLLPSGDHTTGTRKR
ncbi:unnamed protein product [Notodromas monacha]|uniref:Tetratricopeptide repeat protein 39C n=1 Tax=Notodromas monacha TaxID=399045 RepID=A0A7R9G8X7_9CRUS|nr:unnamed protein product [Notodromas monacha]CAG0912558.1 unnamed protein product [Notodromas monacha]